MAVFNDFPKAPEGHSDATIKRSYFTGGKKLAV